LKNVLFDFLIIFFTCLRCGDVSRFNWIDRSYKLTKFSTFRQDLFEGLKNNKYGFTLTIKQKPSDFKEELSEVELIQICVLDQTLFVPCKQNFRMNGEFFFNISYGLIIIQLVEKSKKLIFIENFDLNLILIQELINRILQAHRKKETFNVMFFSKPLMEIDFMVEELEKKMESKNEWKNYLTIFDDGLKSMSLQDDPMIMIIDDQRCTFSARGLFKNITVSQEINSNTKMKINEDFVLDFAINMRKNCWNSFLERSLIHVEEKFKNVTNPVDLISIWKEIKENKDKSLKIGVEIVSKDKEKNKDSLNIEIDPKNNDQDKISVSKLTFICKQIAKQFLKNPLFISARTVFDEANTINIEYLESKEKNLEKEIVEKFGEYKTFLNFFPKKKRDSGHFVD
jgi:hypothetical protein